MIKDGNRKTYKLHRLIAETFIQNSCNYTDVNHKDENKLNNHVDNLEWVTHKYNMNYGTIKDRLRNNKFNKHVLQYDLQGNFIKEWESIRSISKYYNANTGNIVNCCKGRAKHQ